MVKVIHKFTGIIREESQEQAKFLCDWEGYEKLEEPEIEEQEEIIPVQASKNRGRPKKVH